MENEKIKNNEKYLQFEGKVLDDRYVLEKLIGVGGMAVVFRARDLYVNNTTVAIKMLKEDVCGNETVVKRFKNESRAERMLVHPNIVGVYDVSVKGEIKYMVMEYVNGVTLKKYLNAKKEPLSLDEIISYTMQILKALILAHENSIIHRDIKPQNIMVLESGQIKVMDFGIAKVPNTETVTVNDKAIGTVYYMSPEQANAAPVDSRSDIYSLGAMLYEISTGTTPFKGDSAVAILMKHIKETPIPPRQLNPDIPIGLEQIILCAMSKKPNDRFESAREMYDYVKKLQQNKKIRFEKLPCDSVIGSFFGRLKRKFSKKKGKDGKKK